MYYLAALARVESRAAEIALELGLESLALAISENTLMIELQLQDLTDAVASADRH